MGTNSVKISKFLSYILRHDPDSIGLSVDPQGWADLDQLIRRGRKKGRKLTRRMVEKIVYESEKNRFEISDDGHYIRANYGHSIPVNPEYTSTAPPQNLYHGTASSNEGSIRKEGIHAGGRQYVHLSPDKKSARHVGQRHGAPVIVTVKARQMFEDGYDFYPTQSDVWLTAFVPSEYLL